MASTPATGRPKLIALGHATLHARAAMQRHLNQAYKRFSKGWDTLQ